MWLTRVLNIVRVNEPIIKKHTNEFTGIEVGMKMTTDKAWTRRRVKMMTAHLYGRRKIHDICTGLVEEGRQGGGNCPSPCTPSITPVAY